MKIGIAKPINNAKLEVESLIQDIKIHPNPLNPNSDEKENKSKRTSKGESESKKLSNPELVVGGKVRTSYRDNLLGGRDSRNSKMMEAKFRERKSSKVKRSGVKRNNYLPRHIEGKYSVEEVRYLKERLKNNDTFGAIISCLGLVLAWIENEIYFNNQNKSQITNHVMRGIVTGSCLITHYFIFQHYKLQLEIMKSRKIIFQGTSMLKSSLFPRYFLESVFNWIHCPPFLDVQFANEQFGIDFDLTLDAYLSVVMLGRLYIFLRLFDHYTFWTGERAIRVCRINGFLPDSKFAIKAYLKYKSVLMLALSMGLSIFLFGLALRTFERPFVSNLRPLQFNSIWNALWCVVVTMTTIGYGDIYPITFFGRIVVLVACVWGIFMLSLFVVSLNNITQLSKEENKAFEDIIRADKVKSTLHHDAAKIVLTMLKLNVSRKKKADIKKRILMRMDLMGIANRFRIKRKNVQNETKSTNDIVKEMNDDLDTDMYELMETILPLENCIPLINDAEELQGRINEKTLQAHENSKRLMNIILRMKTGKINVENFEQVEPSFDKTNQIFLENQGFINGEGREQESKELKDMDLKSVGY